MRVTDLARHTNVSTAAVCQWELDTDKATEPSHEHLAAVVAAFGISMAEFWGPIPKRRAS